MTTESMKEGEAMPDVWIKYPRGADHESASGVWYAAPGILSDRYVPASRVAELTERLERAVAERARLWNALWQELVYNIGNDIWRCSKCKAQWAGPKPPRRHLDSCPLAAHQEPKT